MHELAKLRLKFDVSGRSCVCMCQALATAVAAAVQRLSDCVAKRDRALVRQWLAIGLLVHEVSLLSTYSKEMGMIGDMAMALRHLNLTLRIVKKQRRVEINKDSPAAAASDIFQVSSLVAVPQSDASNPSAGPAKAPVASSTASVRVVGKKVVTLEVQSDEAFAWLKEEATRSAAHRHDEPDAFSFLVDQHGSGAPDGPGAGDALHIEVHPVMLTLGVNEMQTVANAAHDTALQTDINRKGLQGLRRYLDAFRDYVENEKRSSVPSPDRFGTLYNREDDATANEEDHNNAAVQTCTEMLSELEGLIDSEASLKQRKKVELLMQSCYAARLLNGCRTTSCKSAKDRTSMMYTLELVRLAQKRGVLPGPEGEGRGNRSARSRSLSTISRQQQRRQQGLGCTEQNVLDLLRGINGVRLQNCKDNIGKAKFSFNKVQAATLPNELEPPWWTIATGVKS
jgi:hypothetical protein